ncbi:hypothetical protein BOW53_07645 [Solemya pervernicosa gill symbiont]|uniref:Rhodanese domain-containing protein n=2 Tax=Gammaproteobacteria incertae sedis TaxID=118884 RepID=A0A1T2L5W9_9GAMM|nr:YaeQ family protein [Candidatus Reidiella endopervernicosa]OOZ40440.1 hypothetical protein BOW53_07645 [Solemya pervernicosa gill symbiont]QKQ25353.1 YaeQ family protein [Candidatus Reidiella endopervernicosa]
MAIKATIFKASLQITDMDRNYYQGHELTIARHPSETDERMMLRLLAFARHADEALTFTKGISTDDEPDLWRMDLTGAIDEWIELGQPDEKRIRQACGRSKQVIIYCYSGHSAELWWEQLKAKAAGIKNLSIYSVAPESCKTLGTLAERNMQLHTTIQDGDIWFGNDDQNLAIEISTWQ